MGPKGGMVARRARWTTNAALVVIPLMIFGVAAIVMRADTGGSPPAAKPALQSDAALAAHADRPPDDAGLLQHDTDPAVLEAIAATHPEASGRPEPPTPPSEPPKAGDIPGAWLVQLQPDQPARAVALEHAQTHHAEVTHIYTAAVQGYSANMTDADAAAVAADGRVVNVRRDRLVTAKADSIPTGIRRIGGAPADASIADTDVDVAVIDTGISVHPDLTIAGGVNCNGSGTSFADLDGHGTHVAGTIGAKNNGSGVVGVAPGARLWAVRVLDDNGNGSLANVVCGLNWVRDHASTIEVANESLGGPGSDGPCSSDIEHQAVCDMVAAGVTDVVAAGNAHANAANSTPAAFDQVITVSALADLDGLTGGLAANRCGDVDDTFAQFSNYGADVDVIAPGVCIDSTQPGGGFAVFSGTSMASPHVAGAAALYKARNPSATQADIRTFVTSGTLDWNNSDGRDPDGIKERLVNVSSLWTPDTTTTTEPGATTTTVAGATTTTICKKGCATTSTTAGGSTTTTTTTPGAITLSAAKKKTTNGLTVQLLWSNATTPNVDIYRNGTLRLTTSNDGEYTEASPGSGTWSYQVCEEGSTSVCSPVRSVII